MDKYNSDELEAPEWLNRNFLEDVLTQIEEDKNVKITNFNINPATQKGDHFASIMFRIAVDYLASEKPKHISLILKTMPVMDGAKKEMISSSHAFETEITMYSEIIPKFHKILRDIGDDTVLGAKMIYSSLKPIKIVIFEDLTIQGYKMVPSKHLEPHEIDTVLKKICRWHAISFKLIKEGDESIHKLRDGVFNLGQGMDDFLNESIKGFSNLLSRHNIDPVYSKKFEKLKGTLIQKCRDIYQLQGDLCVLNHGDFHINNLMVKLDQNEIIDDLMLVDFQFCVAAPLIIDLSYLLFAILNPNCRERHDEIIYKYHTLFSEILHNLGYKGKVPTLIDIHRELMLHKELEVIMLVGFMPFMFAIKEDAIDDKLMDNPQTLQKFYEIPDYINITKSILPELLYKGFLE